MNATVQNYINQLKEFWQSKSNKQKGIIIGSILGALILIGVLLFFMTRTNMVPLYSDLTPAETGSIKETLDSMGVPSEITNDGTTIKVPEDQVDTLLVELAAQGIPESGSIDYSFFSENAGLGMTDNEFNVMKLDAMQTELANLIKTVDGIKDANVMITLPKEGVFVADQNEAASASIVITTNPGSNFSESQIKALYTLVSKSVPNLPTDNIVIMDQNFNYYDLKNGENYTQSNLIESQYNMKKEIEKDIQREVQRMLGMLMGHDSVIVSVTADIDFTQEQREENLVEPVDEENMEGIAISAQRLSETYTGENAGAGGVPQAEDQADALGATYVQGAQGSGEYENTEETINYEVNRIRKEIVESPYKIKDLGIQVIVEPPEQPTVGTANIEEDITEILSTIVRTTIDTSDEGDEFTDAEIENKIAVSFQELLGKQDTSSEEVQSQIPLWGYIVIAILVVIIIVLLIFVIRRKRDEDEYYDELEEEEEEKEPTVIPDLIEEQEETEETIRRKQVEKMAKERPDEFAKLLRTWLSQD